jgi:hypothetical protein
MRSGLAPIYLNAAFECPSQPPELEVLRRPVESALAAAIGVVDEATATRRPPRMECLLQRIQDKAGMRGA